MKDAMQTGEIQDDVQGGIYKGEDRSKILYIREQIQTNRYPLPNNS